MPGPGASLICFNHKINSIINGMKKTTIWLIVLLIMGLLPGNSDAGGNSIASRILDEKVKEFLRYHRFNWREMNVPEADGRILYNIIISNHYRRALEIGTSTGHSAIWIAWALSKTNGKLITIEINPERYKTALVNFKKAGLSSFIDARLADAHQLVKKLKGPFDFVFCDADKWWYKNYFIDLYPKLLKGGCYTAHNVWESGWGNWRGGTAEFYRYIKSFSGMETHVETAGSGLSVSCKKAEE
jgi:caffeoyl-CoA O-methyltransferase